MTATVSERITLQGRWCPGHARLRMFALGWVQPPTVPSWLPPRAFSRRVTLRPGKHYAVFLYLRRPGYWKLTATRAGGVVGTVVVRTMWATTGA